MQASEISNTSTNSAAYKLVNNTVKAFLKSDDKGIVASVAQTN
jgi:hypothetical protein